MLTSIFPITHAVTKTTRNPPKMLIGLRRLATKG